MIDEHIERWIEPEAMARARAASIMEHVTDGCLREKLGYACGATGSRDWQPAEITALIMQALREAGLKIVAEEVP